MQAAAAPAEYDVTEFVKPGTGALPRMLDSGYRVADYDLISVISDKDKDGEPCISYTLDTKRARSEVRAQQTQSRLLQQSSVSGASSDQSSDAQIGRTLFNCWCRSRWSRFSAARRRCSWKSIAGLRAFRGNCSTAARP